MVIEVVVFSLLEGVREIGAGEGEIFKRDIERGRIHSDQNKRVFGILRHICHRLKR